MRDRADPTVTWAYFDLDGTLTDPFEGISRSVVHALRPWGLTQTPDELRGWVGPPLRDSFRGVGLSADEAEEAIERFRVRYFDVGWAENRVFGGIPEALEALQAAGFRLGIATSKPTEPARRIVEHFGLAPHFRFVAGASLDGSRDTKADVIAWARSEFSAGHGWMIGDRSHDIEGGRAHRMGTVGVLWGFGSAIELADAGATHLAATPAELPGLLGPAGRSTGP